MYGSFIWDKRIVHGAIFLNLDSFLRMRGVCQSSSPPSQKIKNKKIKTPYQIAEKMDGQWLQIYSVTQYNQGR